MDNKKILIIDDDEWIARMIGDKLKSENFIIEWARNGIEGFEILQRFSPDLVVLDILMPVMDGYEFLLKFRNTAAYSLTPVIILSGKGKEQDIVKGFEYGADNYLIKPSSPTIMFSHIKHTLNLNEKLASLNPLTNLPGNNYITQFTNKLLAQKIKFYFCYIDLDNFKAYNDYYGFDKGDRVLLATADILKRVFGLDKNNFIGHIGGDDFVVIIPNENFEKGVNEFIKLFDEEIKKFYTPNDIRQGGINSVDREGNKKKFGFVALSIGIVPSDIKPFHSILEISDTAVDVKKKAKAMSGSNFYIDKRKDEENRNKLKTNDIKILIDEMQSYSVRIIKHLLTPFGFTIVEASGCDRLMNEYIKNEPHSVFLDSKTDYIKNIIMKIRKFDEAEKRKKCVIIVVSEQLQQTEVIELIKIGVDNIITKPVTKEVLYQKVKEILQARVSLND